MVSINEFRQAFPHLARVKYKRDARRSIAREESEISTSIGIAIVREDIESSRLTNQELLAAIFAVNYIVKFYKEVDSEIDLDEALERKNALQRTLVQRKGIALRRGYGQYRKTVEIRIHIWITHVPLFLLKEWGVRIKLH